MVRVSCSSSSCRSCPRPFTPGLRPGSAKPHKHFRTALVEPPSISTVRSHYLAHLEAGGLSQPGGSRGPQQRTCKRLSKNRRPRPASGDPRKSRSRRAEFPPRHAAERFRSSREERSSSESESTRVRRGTMGARLLRGDDSQEGSQQCDPLRVKTVRTPSRRHPPRAATWPLTPGASPGSREWLGQIPLFR